VCAVWGMVAVTVLLPQAVGTEVCIYMAHRAGDVAQLVSSGILPVLVANFFACGSDHSDEDDGPAVVVSSQVWVPPPHP
jgi:hypothetical protein